jgi:polyisoprenyl-phosphate glycosyltransferase
MAFDISVIIPVKNEEESIPLLISEIDNVLKNLELKYEIIFITDDNDDNTWEILKIEHKKMRNIQLIKLTRSKGQHIAIIAGLKYCNGDCALIMDGDLEMPAHEITKLYREYIKGVDIVYGTNKNKNHSFLGDIFSRSFNFFMQKFSDEIIDFNTDMFRIISRRTIDKLLQFNEINPNISYLISLINYPSRSVQVDFDNRKYGNTNYSFFRKLRMGINSFLSFSTMPINFISFIGFTISITSFIYLIFVIIQKVFISNYSGFSFGTIAVMISFFSGVQLLSIGIIGTYISRNFIQNKSRPHYIIEEKLWNKKS